MREALSIEHLSHAYGDAAVLDDVSLSVSAGELVSILGHSGVGKTTLLRAIGGFLAPGSGTIRLGDRVVAEGGRIRVPPESRGLGIVFQDYALFGHMTVAQNVGFGIPRSERATRTPEMLALVGLSDYAQRRPAELSGGQQQRAALARALAPRPRLLLMDEPFANLDAGLRARLRDELRRLLRETETAGMLITHDRSEALSIADRVAVLVPGPKGAVLGQVAPPSQVYLHPASEAVARLTGEGTPIEGIARARTCRTALGEIDLVEPRTGPTRVWVRPEQVDFRPDPAGHARVVSAQYRGATAWVVLRIDGVRGDAPPAEAVEIGIEMAATAMPRVDEVGHVMARNALWGFTS